MLEVKAPTRRLDETPENDGVFQLHLFLLIHTRLIMKEVLTPYLICLL